MNKIKKFFEKAFDVLDDVVVYIATVIGILVKNYLPLAYTTEVIQFQIDIKRVVLAALMGFVVMAWQDKIRIAKLPEATEETKKISKAVARAGRRKQFPKRVAVGFMAGIASSVGIDAIVQSGII